MEQTSLEELKRTAASGAYRRIPIWREIFSDIATPVQVLKKLLAVSDHCFLLESAEDNKPVSYTHLRAHETDSYLVCRLLLEKKKKKEKIKNFQHRTQYQTIK